MHKEILIIEDDDRFRHSIKLLLGDTDYKLHEASSVPEGLRLLEERPTVRVIILDLAFPGSSGADFLERIEDRSSKYRVIVLTAHDELFAAEVAKSFEVFAYMSKSAQSIREPLRFQVAAAFNDLERAWLLKKAAFHLEIDRRVRYFGTTGVNGDQELEEVLNLICGHLVELMDVYTCHIRLLDAQTGEFVLRAGRGRVERLENVLNERKPYGGAYSGIAAETKAALNIDDIQDNQFFKDIKESALSRGEIGAAFKQYLADVRSAYVVPISTGLFGDEIDAVLNVTSDVPAFFTAARIELVDDFVNQIVIAITKYWLKRKGNETLADHKNISDMLAEVSDELKGEPDKIYHIVFKRISAGLKPEVISIFRYDEQKGRLVNVDEFRGNQRMSLIAEEYAPGEGLVGRIYSASTPVRINIKQETQGGLTTYEDSPEGLIQERVENIPSGGIRHYLGVPIRIGNETIGVIRVINKKSAYYDSEENKTSRICLLRTGFSEDCQTTLEITASHLALAIQNAELIGKLNMKVSQLESIHKIGLEISSEMDVNAVLDLIVASAAQVMHAEICILFLKNESGDNIVLRHSYGMPTIEGAFYHLGEGKVGHVAQTGMPILEKHALESHRGKYDKEITRFLREEHRDDSKGIDSYMAVPIIGKGHILGVIKVINKVLSPFQFDEDDLMLFQIFASQIGLERVLYIQKYLNNIVENSPEPMMFLDKHGRVEVFNRACEHLWGYSSEAVIGRSVVDFYASEEQAREIGRRLWQSEDHRIHNVEAEMRDSHGSVIPVSLSSAFLFDEDGKRTGTIGVFKDLREIKRLESQMVQAEKLAAIGKLTHSIGHDIKTQIATALNYVDVLLMESKKPLAESTNTSKEEYVEIYTDITSALHEATRKIRHILTAAQPESVKRTAVRLSDIFAEIHSTMARQANYKRVEFIERGTDDPRPVLVDIEKITQALWNLFDNSLEAIDKKSSDNLSSRGRIEVSVSASGKLMELTWKDDGCGIPEEMQPNIFDAFYTANKANGSGLGLYIVKRIVEDHGGTIHVYSIEGQGACFRMSLPVVQTERA